MPKPKNTHRLLISLIFFLYSGLFLDRSLHAQSEPIREEPKGLQEQIDELKEAQKALQKELQEIKGLLQGRVGVPNLPSPNLTVSVGRSPLKGDKAAKLTLVEFSDYQCPFCTRFFKETLPSIEQEYISIGKLKYVLRDYPLEAIHKDALKAAEGAKCAGEQEKYWEMHDRLFRNQNQLGAAELPKHAQAIGLNLSAFQECLDKGKQVAEIRKDMEDARKLGVQGTPTFFLGTQDSAGQNIKVLTTIYGAQPYAQFKQAIEGALSQMEKQ